MSILASCGWEIIFPKHLPIAQQKIFLGFTVNSIPMEFEIPVVKLEKFFYKLEKIQSQETFPARLDLFSGGY